MVGSVTPANTLIKYMTIGINVTHECFMSTLWANPFTAFRQTVLILYHRKSGMLFTAFKVFI